MKTLLGCVTLVAGLVICAMIVGALIAVAIRTVEALL